MDDRKQFDHGFPSLIQKAELADIVVEKGGFDRLPTEEYRS